MLSTMDKELKKQREQFARNLRARRAYLGLTQEQLAEYAGLERTYISQIEKNNANPTLNVLHQLAAALETSISELLDKS